MRNLSSLVARTGAALLLALFTSFAVHAANPGTTSVDTMIIGDSVFALSGDIHKFLERDLNKKIDTHARSGCQMIGGNVLCPRTSAIPRQYANASKRGIKTVIFNGGGNDIQLNSCAPSLTRCMTLLNSLETEIATLVRQMKADGIQNIIFLGYYNASGDKANLREINEYSMNYKARNYPAMGVKFVDVRAAFNGNEGSYLLRDGIHPTATGSQVLADLIRRAL